MKKKAARDEVVSKILESLQQAVAIQRGELKPARVTRLEAPNVIEARRQLKVSRPTFAAMLGVSERTVESWEQGLRKPSGAARALLKVVVKEPEAVLRAFKS
jgi:putative transcriptional regulator